MSAFETLTMKYWESLSDKEATALAKEIERSVASKISQKISFSKLEKRVLEVKGKPRRDFRVARFLIEECAFHLIPATEATIGLDPKTYVPSQYLLQDLHNSFDDWDITKYPVSRFLKMAMIKPKTIELGSLLVEARPQSIASIAGLHKEHHNITEYMQQLGMRLPQIDEWRFLSNAGAMTLFPWGDDVPNEDAQAIEDYQKELEKKAHSLFQKAFIKAQKLYKGMTIEGGFNICPEMECLGSEEYKNAHRNLFGLLFSYNNSVSELIEAHFDAQTGKRITNVGGDGGSAECGGFGAFAVWIVWAPSVMTSEAYTVQDYGNQYDIYRRIIDI